MKHLHKVTVVLAVSAALITMGAAMRSVRAPASGEHDADGRTAADSRHSDPTPFERHSVDIETPNTTSRAALGATSREAPGSRPQLAEELPFSGNTAAGKALNDYIRADNEPGDDMSTRARREAALERLRELSQQTLPMLANAYHSLPRSDFPTRERIVQTMNDMSLHSAEPLLTDIAHEPLPPLDPADEEGTRGLMEGSLRIAAMEGLRDLAARGNASAKSSLEEMMRDAPTGLKKEAVGLYLEAGADLRAQQREAAQVLPEEDRWMVHRVTITSAEALPTIRGSGMPSAHARGVSGPKAASDGLAQRDGAAGSPAPSEGAP